MGMDKNIMYVISFFLGILIFHLLKGYCGCNNVVEGQITCSDLAAGADPTDEASWTDVADGESNLLTGTDTCNDVVLAINNDGAIAECPYYRQNVDGIVSPCIAADTSDTNNLNCVAGAECSSSGTVTVETPQTYSWHADNFPECPTDCGSGASKLFRDVTCADNNGNLAADVASCVEDGPPPPRKYICDATAECVTYSWHADKFPKCPTDCGLDANHLTRPVHCMSSTGISEHTDKCPNDPKPASTKPCAATDPCAGCCA